MVEMGSEASSTTSVSSGGTGFVLVALSFDACLHTLSHTFKTLPIGHCCCVLAAADATSDCRRLVRHAGSKAEQLAAGAGALGRDGARARERLCRCVSAVLRESTRGRPRER